MTWAVSPELRRPGDLLTRGDVCHLHEDRGEAERCGALLGGVPELVRLSGTRSACTGWCGRCRTRPAERCGGLLLQRRQGRSTLRAWL